MIGPSPKEAKSERSENDRNTREERKRGEILQQSGCSKQGDNLADRKKRDEAFDGNFRQ